MKQCKDCKYYQRKDVTDERWYRLCIKKMEMTLKNDSCPSFEARGRFDHILNLNKLVRN